MNLNDPPPEARGIVVRLDGLDCTCAFDDPPDASFELTAPVLRGLELLKTIDARLAAIRADSGLSDLGKQREIAKMEDDLRKITSLFDHTDHAADDLDAINRALVAAIVEPPPLEPTDLNARSDDGEIRAWVSGLDADRRATFLTEMTAGKHPRLAIALARSPVPTLEKQMALATLREQLPPKEQDELAATEKQRAKIEWARGAIGSMRMALGRRR